MTSGDQEPPSIAAGADVTAPHPSVGPRSPQAPSPAAAEAGTEVAPLRVAYLIDVFPRPSNTFIVDQIAGVADRGLEVDVVARAQLRDGLRHEAIARLGLLEHNRHIPVPAGKAQRLTTFARLLAEPAAWRLPMLRELLRAPTSPGWLARQYTALSFLRSRPYDVVHCQFGTLGPMAVAMRRSGVLAGAVVTSFRGADATSALQAEPERYRDLFRHGDLFLPVSDSLRTILVAAGCPPERTVVHHSGIQVARFDYEPRLRTDDEAMACLFVGRLTEKKGVRFALEALALLLHQGRRIHLDIVGEGEERVPLEELTRTLGIAAAVRFLGRQTPAEVKAHMLRSQLLVAPSVTSRDGDQEGIPNVLKEAMATGLPVLATYHSGIPELVEEGVSGLLVPERDTAALAVQWAFLDDHPERWPAMGKAGRATVEERFDGPKLTTALIGHYRDVVAKRGARAAG